MHKIIVDEDRRFHSLPLGSRQRSDNPALVLAAVQQDQSSKEMPDTNPPPPAEQLVEEFKQEEKAKPSVEVPVPRDILYLLFLYIKLYIANVLNT